MGDICGSGSGGEGPTHDGHDIFHADSPADVVSDLDGGQGGAGDSCGRGSGNEGPDGGAMTVDDDGWDGEITVLREHHGSVAGRSTRLGPSRDPSSCGGDGRDEIAGSGDSGDGGGGSGGGAGAAGHASGVPTAPHPRDDSDNDTIGSTDGMDPGSGGGSDSSAGAGTASADFVEADPRNAGEDEDGQRGSDGSTAVGGGNFGPAPPSGRCGEGGDGTDDGGEGGLGDPVGTSSGDGGADAVHYSSRTNDSGSASGGGAPRNLNKWLRNKARHKRKSTGQHAAPGGGANVSDK